MDNIAVNARIIQRDINNQSFLVNPDRNRFFTLNKSGKKIWQSLISGTTWEKLCKQLPDKKYQEQLKEFLIELYKNSCIFLPPELNPPQIPDQTESSPVVSAVHDKNIVLGNSMIRTLSPGDLLITTPENFQNLKVGDVITFEGIKNTVHRIIRRNSDGSFITIGDNNDSHDDGCVTAGNFIALVVAKITRSGKKINVSRGKAGMVKYYINRSRRFFRVTAGKFVNLLLPAAFWRKTPDRSCRFGDIVQFYCGEKVIMWQIDNHFIYKKLIYKFLYRFPRKNIEQ